MWSSFSALFFSMSCEEDDLSVVPCLLRFLDLDLDFVFLDLYLDLFLPVVDLGALEFESAVAMGTWVCERSGWVLCGCGDAWVVSPGAGTEWSE